MGNKKSLIDAVAAKVGCEYLSDLRTASYRKEAVNCLRSISDSQYSMDEWKEAVSYLIGTQKENITSKSQARQMIIEAIQKSD